MTGFALLFGLLCVFGGLQSGVFAQDGEKFSYPRALERIESLVGSLNESLQETKEDLQAVRLCLNETKKKLGEVQREKQTLEAQLLETRNELAVIKSLHQQEIDDLRATQGSTRMEALEEMSQIRMKISDLEDEELPRQLSELSEDLSDVTRDVRRLEDENLPRRVNELVIDNRGILTKLVASDFKHNSTTYKLKDELRQLNSETQKLESKLEAALSTFPDEQLVDRVQELTDKYSSLQLKLAEVESGEEEWESRIAMSSALMEVKGSLSDIGSLLSNMSASVEQGLNVTKANISRVKGEVEMVEKELCEKMQNLSIQVEDVQQRSVQSVSDLSQKVNTANAVVSQQQDSIVGLSRDLLQQSNTVTRLSDRVTQYCTTTDRLRQRVAEQESSVNSLSSNIQMQVHTTETLTSTVTEQGVCIAHMKHDVEDIKVDARTLQYQQRNVSMQLMKLHGLTSCKELYQHNPATPSGYYYIWTPQGVKSVYCEMDTSNCGDVRGGWMRVAHINMTDPRHTCPQGLRYIVQSSKRMCAHLNSVRGCSSIIFPQHGVPYTKVCGRARGYQYGHTESFRGSHYHALHQSLEGYYVQGLAVTHGTPRRHIWTFAAGVSNDASFYFDNCPCVRHPYIAAPLLVGENYYCESGWRWGKGTPWQQWQLDDPLWDSQGCPVGGNCCNRGGPWFNTTLSQEVSDDIEVRWCSYGESFSDFGVDQLEIFVH